MARAVDDLIALGLRQGHVVLGAGDCAACPWKAGGEAAGAAAAVATQALHALGYPHAHISLAHGSARATSPTGTESGRESLALFTGEGAPVARQLLPEPPVKPTRLSYRVPPGRSRWVNALPPDAAPAERPMPPGPWKLRTATEACNGCGICVMFCPTGARIATDGAEWVLTHRPTVCIGCGTCQALCPTKAIGEAPLFAQEMATGQVHEQTRLVALTCDLCHKEFKGRPGAERCPKCTSFQNLFR